MQSVFQASPINKQAHGKQTLLYRCSHVGRVIILFPITALKVYITLCVPIIYNSQAIHITIDNQYLVNKAAHNTNV